MTRRKRAFVMACAGLGWAMAGGLTLAAPFVEVAQQHPFLVNRIFALLALGASTLTIVWWLDSTRREIPLPAETAYDLGVEFGKSLGRMEAATWNSGAASPFDQIMKTEGSAGHSPGRMA